MKTVFFLTFLFVLIVSCKESDKSKLNPYTIAYTSNESWNIEIYQGSTDGSSTTKSTNENGGYVAWSPEGKRIAFYAKYDNKKTWSIHTMNNDGTNRKRLTHTKDHWDNSPTWSPDGTKIIYAKAYRDSTKAWHHELWIMKADGTNKKQIKGIEGGGPYFISDDKIIFHSQPAPSEIFIANIDGSNQIQLTHNETEDWHPEVSPNGAQVVFMSNREGVHQIYTMNIDGSNQKPLTSQEFDCWYPSWSPDGTQLIFKTGDSDKKERLIYIINKDGSGMRKIIDGGSQAAWLKLRK